MPGTALGDVNERLKQHVAPFNVAGLRIEPVHLLGLALAGLVFGIKGMALVALVVLIMGQQR